MARFILRVWLPDKPGALGRVAGALGSVGSSLIGIDILEQDGGSAIDELIVDAVDSPNAVEKLVAALQLLDGVNLEDIRESPGEMVDPRVDALDTAAELVEQAKVPSLIEVLVRRARHDMNATWAVFIGHNDQEPRMTTGDVPASAWIKAFVAGSKSSQELGLVNTGPDDIAWTELVHAEAALVLGRERRPFRARERQQLAALARIADRRLRELPD